METVQLTIDSKKVEVAKGTTILEAAKSIGIDIPTLCHMKLHDINFENNPYFQAWFTGETDNSNPIYTD